MKKKVWIGAAAAVMIAGAAGVGVWMLVSQGEKDGGKEVYVSSVAGMQDMAGGGLWNRYTGVAETQDSWETAVVPDKDVAVWYVEEGQEVAEGTELFRYDTTKTEESLAQAQLDLETIANDKQNLNQQLAALDKARKEAQKEEQVSYDIEILNIQASLKAKDLEEANKTSEIASLQKNIDTAAVTSPIAGIVKSINQTGDQTNANGALEPLISVVGTGGIRIKGTVNELNMASLTEGAAVIVRSRVDEDIIWRGTITEIDAKTPETAAGMDGSSSTKYPFYVELDDTDALMLGQHVLVEMDFGQTANREGIWLDAFMIAGFNDSPYVWADDGDSRLEKRNVVLGTYDEGRSQYEIKSGLSQADWITFPEEDLTEGSKTVKSQTGQMGTKDPQPEGLDSDGEKREQEDGNVMEAPEQNGAVEIPENNGIMVEQEVILGSAAFQTEIGF